MAEPVLLEFAVDSIEANFIVGRGVPGPDVCPLAYAKLEHQPGTFAPLAPLSEAQAEALLEQLTDPELRYLRARIQAKLDILKAEQVDLAEKAVEKAAKKAEGLTLKQAAVDSQFPPNVPQDPNNALF